MVSCRALRVIQHTVMFRFSFPFNEEEKAYRQVFKILSTVAW